MKFIKRKSAVKPITGSIVDSTNIADKTKNTYSANVIDKMNTYSSVETVIGIWIDGKPLYRKVFYIQLATSTDKSVAEVRTNVASLNIDKVTRFDGTIQQSNFAVFPANFVYLGSGLNNYFFGLLNYDSATKEIQIRHNADWLSGQYENVILEYTKTTD